METQPTPHSNEQLERLYAEGSISADEYETLREALQTRRERRKAPEPKPADARSEQQRASPWGFAAALFVMWFIHIFLVIFVIPNSVRVFAQRGVELPTISVLALSLGQSLMNMGSLGFVAQILLMAVIGWAYSFLPRKSPIRWIFWLGAFGLFAILMLFYILALGLPFIRVEQVTH